MPPPAGLLDVAGYWLGMDETDREVLRAFTGHQLLLDNSIRFSQAVPENYFRDWYADDFDLWYRLHQIGAFMIEGDRPSVSLDEVESRHVPDEFADIVKR